MSILALNAGSSSLKFGLFNDQATERLFSGELDWASGDRRQAQLTLRPRRGAIVRSRLAVPDSSMAAGTAIQAVLGSNASADAKAISAVGHRVVHGGTEFRASVWVDGRVKAAIARLGDVAPLHNPPALHAIHSAEATLPGIPQIAVFDTSFYAQLGPENYLYGVPYAWHQNWGIRRFGFHGISHAYCVARAAELINRPLSSLRIVSCHLGGGCTATAVDRGVAAATTGGFSPLDGLMMGTRCGSIDPGILIHLQRQEGLTGEDLSRALNYSSGLLGVSGVSADLAEIEAAIGQGNERARVAFDMFADRVRSAVASLAASMGGLDVLTFTDRIGEGSPALRAAVCDRLGFMGIQLDPGRNHAARADVDVASATSGVRVFVIHTEEELMVARETRDVVQRAGNERIRP